MEEYNFPPETISYDRLLRVLSERVIDDLDQYRTVYIIQLIQRLQVLIHQQRRRIRSV